jgi:MATE family multidrug resistance protein
VIRQEARDLLRLALPVVAAQVGMMLLGTVDTAMVGQLDATSLAAAALCGTYSFALLIFGQGVLHALDPIVSQAFGAGEHEAVGEALGRGLVMAAILSVPYVAIFLASEPVLLWLKQPPEVVAIAGPFLRALAPGVPAFFGFVAVRQTLQACGVTAPVLWAVGLGNVANYIGNVIFIRGAEAFGVVRLGALGSAWSTTVCRWLMLAVILWAARRALAGMWPKWSSALVERQPLARMVAVGLPTGLQIGLEMWVFTAAALLIGAMGPRQMAAHQIAINLASLSFMVPLGLGSAAAARVGQAIGRRDLDGARRAAAVALVAGAAVMLVSASIFWAVPEVLAAWFSTDKELIEGAAGLIAIGALFQIFDGAQAVGCGILRGAADTRAGAVINFIGYWIIGLPVGVVLRDRYGAAGLWWGLTLGLAVVAALLVWRVRRTFRGSLERV